MFRIGLLEYGFPDVDNSPYEWQMLETLDTFTSEHPHQIARSAHGVEPDEVDGSITRSEMILLVTMILARMVVLPRLAEHEVYPVSLLLTLSQSHLYTHFFL